jgi:hypothetical protein
MEPQGVVTFLAAPGPAPDLVPKRWVLHPYGQVSKPMALWVRVIE